MNPIHLHATPAIALLLAGCISLPRTYDSPELRVQCEKELEGRELDPIEGFWHSENEYVEGVGVICRVDPATNDGFPFAGRGIRIRQKVALPHHLGDPHRVAGRWKPTSTANVYRGQVVLFRGYRSFWEDATATLRSRAVTS